jgi:four helix bundle protein
VVGEKVTRFEDLVVWQKARALTAAIYEATASGGFARDYGLTDQMRRAAVSIMSNIAEGFERGRPPEFSHFLLIAKGSCAELRAQLYVACDVSHLSRETFDTLLAQADEVGRMLSGLRATVERKRDTL